jgi:abortive infection bacteriophage resistance protein
MKSEMSRYNKPHLTFEQQLELLKLRGLEVTNDNIALEYSTPVE